MGFRRAIGLRIFIASQCCVIRRQHFPATSSSARAERSVGHKRHMPKAAETDLCAYMKLTINNQSSAETFNNEYKQQRTNVCFFQRSIPQFSKRSRICVIFDKD